MMRLRAYELTKISGLALTLLMILALLSAGAVQQPSVLKVASTSVITSWDPALSASVEMRYLINIYEPLLYVNPPGSKELYRPGLAVDWDISDDGLTYTFYLRQGVKFHDGEPFNAEAVKASIEYIKSKGVHTNWDAVEEIDVLDEYTVQLKLSYTVPLLRLAAAETGAWMISPKAIEKGTDWFEQGHEAGTGPYMLESWRPREEIVLTRFNNWWGESPENGFDKIFVRIVPESVVQRQMLEAGEVDLATVVPVESIPALQENPDITVIIKPGLYIYSLYLNTQKPPLDNPLVRRAISYAIPYQDIIDIAAPYGLGTQARGPVPGGIWPSDPAVEQYKYNLDKAKELLAQAGFPNGLDRKLVLTWTAENPAEERFVPLVKESLAKIGIDVEVRSYLWAQQWALAKETPPAEAQDIFTLLNWVTYPDGYAMLSVFEVEEQPLWNLSYWYHPDEYDSLVEEAHKLTDVDPDRSKGLYLLAQDYLIDEAPAVWLYNANMVVQMRSNIGGDPIATYYPFALFFNNLYRK